MTAIGAPNSVLGSESAVEQGTRFTWEYFSGERRTETWRGPSAAVFALYRSYQAVSANNPEFDSMDFDAGRGVGMLSLNRVEDGAAIYELFSNEERRAIESHPYFLTDGTPLTAAQIRAVFLAFDEGQAEVTTAWLQKQKDLFNLLCLGTTEYLASTFVLRESMRVSKRSTVAAAHTTVDRVEDPPSISSVNTLIGSLPEGEWLRRGTIVRQVASRRWEILTEWWWAKKWSAVLYGGTLSP